MKKREVVAIDGAADIEMAAKRRKLSRPQSPHHPPLSISSDTEVINAQDYLTHQFKQHHETMESRYINDLDAYTVLANHAALTRSLSAQLSLQINQLEHQLDQVQGRNDRMDHFISTAMPLFFSHSSAQLSTPAAAAAAAAAAADPHPNPTQSQNRNRVGNAGLFWKMERTCWSLYYHLSSLETDRLLHSLTQHYAMISPATHTHKDTDLNMDVETLERQGEYMRDLMIRLAKEYALGKAITSTTTTAAAAGQ